MGVDHLPRLAQNELVRRIANHGLVLLGNLLYGLAELHKLRLYQLRSSTHRATDGFSEPLQAGCIGRWPCTSKNIAKNSRAELLRQSQL